MHEGFVNYNAGTLGASMVEGRISAGVVVGDGSDVGGGASIMGTLSGGGTEVISIGERCLLGANSGIGISLGDDCVVEAGTYVTGGHEGRAARTGGWSRPGSCPGGTACCSGATASTGALEVVDRSGGRGRPGPVSTQTCTRTCRTSDQRAGNTGGAPRRRHPRRHRPAGDAGGVRRALADSAEAAAGPDLELRRDQLAVHARARNRPPTPPRSARSRPPGSCRRGP